MKDKKVYCGQCKFHTGFHSCNKNPEVLKVEFLAPGQTRTSQIACGIKNKDNDCKEFEAGISAEAKLYKETQERLHTQEKK